MTRRLACSALLLSTSLWPWLAAPVRAEPAPPHTYAVIVGSNPGGPGQSRLQYAERDAQQIAALMRELGRTPADNTRLLLSPRASEVRAALAALGTTLAAHAQRGEPTQLLFYYSGHARAEAANLGDEVLPLAELRSALLALPATLKVVVLDACQSGAFSNVKGAERAADFSFNSVRRLDTQGVAVLASSSGAELSQESEQLGASFFTHHLLSALRGAGDANGDGRVSLDELYRYAYENTLADTARTQVGSQHVTLETDLKGKGDVSLSFPLDAPAHLWFASGLEAELLVQQQQGKSVMAELHKAKGAPLKLALPAGAYQVTLRAAGLVRACSVTLSDGSDVALDPSKCAQVEQTLGLSKGGARGSERWFLELGVRVGGSPSDAYTDRLETFSYDDAGDTTTLGGSGLAGVTLHPNFTIFVRYAGLQRAHYQRSFSGETDDADDFSWSSHGMGGGARARLPLVQEWMALYAQVTGGAATVSSKWSALDADGVREDYGERQWGPWVEGALGFQGHFTRNFGAFVEAGWGYTNALRNLLDESHNLSGGYFLTGLRVRSLRGREVSR
jgi:Caspase domain